MKRAIKKFRTPKELGTLLYMQPLDPQHELRIRRLGIIMNAVIVAFGWVMGMAMVYGWVLYGKSHYLLIGLGIILFCAWMTREIWFALTRVRIGYVCKLGVGYYVVKANGELVETNVYPFSPNTRIKERKGRTGPIANLRDYWELTFYEGRKKRYTIRFEDFGRDGYGYSEPDDPDLMEYGLAKEAFLHYQQAYADSNVR